MKNCGSYSLGPALCALLCIILSSWCFSPVKAQNAQFEGQILPSIASNPTKDKTPMLSLNGKTILVDLHKKITSRAEDKISVYPQPAFKTLYVKLESKAVTDVRILLATIHGKELLNASARIGKGETIVTINTDTINPGTYVLTVNAGDLRHEQHVVFESADASK